MGNESYISDKFAIDELLQRSWSFRSSAEFKKFFDFIASFDHYSRYNSMLVYIQDPSVTFFGGISYWKKYFNRKIKDDPKRTYIILAPQGPIMLAYDIFDTIGWESPEEFLKKGLGRKPFEVKGKVKDEVLTYAIEESKKWGIKVVYKPLSFFKAGHVTTIHAGRLEICLKEGMNNEENLTVLIHELAHLFLGHTGHLRVIHVEKGKTHKLLQRVLNKSTKELEAETISYLITKKLGLIGQSSEYIAGYITCEKDLLQFNYEIVIKTADYIENQFIKTSFIVMVDKLVKVNQLNLFS